MTNSKAFQEHMSDAASSLAEVMELLDTATLPAQLLADTRLKRARKVVESLRPVGTIYAEDDDGNVDTSFTIARHRKASDETVRKVLEAPESLTLDYARGPWQLFRLQNGDLIFGCYPQGQLYEELEGDASF